jgi:hypothetical protein
MTIIPLTREIYNSLLVNIPEDMRISDEAAFPFVHVLFFTATGEGVYFAPAVIEESDGKVTGKFEPLDTKER